ncbi:MAG: hypothetical protein HOC78_03990 [Candidatus Komeilibacteria bacterium]|jgi:hypothetical protein|nr:hypothetical protein [Candidatus Komeilibacteria bacterium]
MTQNIIVQAAKILLIDLIGELLYFPIWWYTQGLKRVVLYVFNSIKNTNRNLAVGLMFKSLFKPMFGQYDREGRIISFFFRLILTFARTIAFLILVAIYLLAIVFWILLPVAVVWGIYNNINTLWKA